MSPHLVAMTPFDVDGDLGAAYNRTMRLVAEDDWVLFMDHDMMLTTREWYRQVLEAIAFRPDAGAFVAMTNRIAAPWQQIGASENHDVAHHRRFGAERLKVRTLLDVTDTNGFGGVCFAISRAVWAEVGGFADGMLCVDHLFHFAARRHGRRIYLHEGFYVYHWRRAFGDNLPAGVPKAAHCPCRGSEPVPTVRIALP